MNTNQPTLKHDRQFRLLHRSLCSTLLLGSIAIPLAGSAMPKPAQHSSAARSLSSLVESASNKQIPPEALPVPIAVVSPINGTVTIRLVNQTGAAISYQVIEDTQFRSLNGRSEITLRSLTIPTTLTFRRDDGGLLRVSLQANNPSGTITLTLNETADFATDRTTLTVERSGGVYLN